MLNIQSFQKLGNQIGSYSNIVHTTIFLTGGDSLNVLFLHFVKYNYSEEYLA